MTRGNGNSEIRRLRIGDAPIDAVSAENAARWVLDRRNRGLRTCVAPVNAATIVLASRQPSFRQALGVFDLALADGFWPALAATCLSGCRVPHTNTSPFLRALFRQAGAGGLAVFLVGAQPNVVKKVPSQLPRFHPGASVVGYEHGYFERDEEARIVNTINASGADIVLLGISSPKKELFIQRNWSELRVPLRGSGL